MEKTLSTEEADMVQRSSKKVKRKAGVHHEQGQGEEAGRADSMETDNLVEDTHPLIEMEERQTRSYSSATKGGHTVYRGQGHCIEEMTWFLMMT